ncbi:MAG TPA: gluconokinase [Microbacterium sp.]|nr:gluconokinase [Microbacterium sp.]
MAATDQATLAETSEVDPPIVLVVMGVSGSGKSTVAGMLAGRLGWDLEEGDDLHPAANVEKMAAGVPLTDEDRWPWLDKISAWIQLHTASGTPGIVTCSALRRVYRDRLSGPGVAFVHLDGSRDAIATRLSNRLDHFMPQSLLGSQFATLEPLEPDENGVVIQLGQGPKDEVREIMRRLHLSAMPAPNYTDEGLLAD